MITGRLGICTILLAVVVLLNLPLPASLRVKSGARDAVLPFQNVMSLVLAGASRGWVALADARAVSDEKQRLEEELARLSVRVHRIEELERDNERLRRLLEFKARERHRLVLGEVVARGDTSGWWRTLELNCGRSQQVAPDMAVITPSGLVGRTQHVSGQTCTVLLLTDPQFKVSCRLARSGVFGILRGVTKGGGADPELEMLTAAEPCLLDYLSKDDEVREGDTVVTSGLGGVFPPGIVVGRVASVALAPSGLYRVAAVVPAARLEALRYAFVMVK